MKKYQIFDGAILKIIAMVTMVIDHVGYYFYTKLSSNCYQLMRHIGRVSFPIYAYLIVEGMKYTRKPLKYISQLLLLGIIVTLGEIIFLKEYNGNVMSTLGLSALAIYFIERNKYKKILSIIPITIICLSTFNFFPIKCMYDIYGLLTIILFYLVDKITIYISNKIHQDKEINGLTSYKIVKNNGDYMLIRNAFSIVIFILFTFVCKSLFHNTSIFIKGQEYAIFVAIPLFLYNGKRGYNKPWFKWGCYIFYPLQFVLIYLIGLLI